VYDSSEEHFKESLKGEILEILDKSYSENLSKISIVVLKLLKSAS